MAETFFRTLEISGSFGIFRLAGPRERLAQFDGYLAIRRVSARKLKRQRRRARQIDGQRGVGQHLVRGDVIRVAVEDLLGDVDGFEWIRAQGDLPSGQQRRTAGCAEHFFQETAFAARSFRLRGPQCLATGVKARLLLQHLIEDGDGVVEVLALEGSDPFFVLFTQRAGNGSWTLFRHGKDCSDYRAKIHLNRDDGGNIDTDI